MIPRLTSADQRFIAAFGAIKIVLHLPVLGRYGYHHDELYFLACGHHLSVGYVDHPPMVPWLARLAHELFGPSLFGLRLLPMLAGALLVMLTVWMAHSLGGGRFAQAVAGVGVLTAPVYVRLANLFCIPAFEVALWMVAFHLLIRILDRSEDGSASGHGEKLWPWLGLVAGLGLLTKHSMLFFGFGLVVALALTPHRRHFRSPWLYFGGLIALVVFLPNLIWQMSNDWPTVQFLGGLHENVMSRIPGALFIAGQFLYIGPAAAPIWIAGLGFLFSPAGRRFRYLGWVWLACFVLLLVLKSKIYYLAPAYPPLLAAGGCMIEKFAKQGRPWVRPALAVWIATLTLVLLPLSLPVFSIDATESYIRKITFGAFNNLYELTADLRGMFGWQERLEAVAEVWHGLSPAEQERAVVLGSDYGNAGAIDYFGAEFGLPSAVSTHMSYHLWGLPDREIDILVAVNVPLRDLEVYYQDIELVAERELENVNPWDREFRVYVARKPKADLRREWPGLKRWN